MLIIEEDICPCFDSFGRKFQVLLQVIDNGGEVHTFVGLPDANGIYFSQPQKLFEGAKHRFHGTLSFAFHIAAAPAFYPFDIPFVQNY